MKHLMRTSWKRLRPARRFALPALAAVLVLAACVVIPVLLLSVFNADFYGRMIELKTVEGWPGFPKSASSPEITVRVVIHRLIPDENSAELSAIVSMNPGELPKLVQQNDKTLTVTVRDGSSMQPYDLGGSIVLPVDSAKYKVTATESERFRLPTLSSVSGFPFDDSRLYIPVYVHGSGGLDYPFRLEIQKAFPGRILEASLRHGETPLVVFKRSPLEQILVMTTSVIFLLICVLVATRLFSKSTKLRGFEEVLALAGFLVASVEFRNSLDVPKALGTSAFEIMIFALPLAILAVGFAAIALRDRRGTSTDS